MRSVTVDLGILGRIPLQLETVAVGSDREIARVHVVRNGTAHHAPELESLAELLGLDLDAHFADALRGARVPAAS